MADDLETAEMKRLLRTLGARPSASAEAARELELVAIRAMSVEERMVLALRLGKRDRATHLGHLAHLARLARP